MFKVGNRVRISNPKASRDAWKENVGTIIEILDAHNSFTNKDEKVHIIRLDDGREAPVEIKFMSLCD